LSVAERIDIAAARKKLESLEGREYWRSFEEVLGGADFRAHTENEFRHELPVHGEPPADGGIDRRSLITLMGASAALAGLTGCTRQPTERIFPYVRPPEEVVPGEPLFYATAHVHGGFARGIVARSYEGRPVKIEGNELHPASLGGTDAFAQAFILNLYDPDRSQTATERGTIRPWTAFLGAARLALEKERATRGAGLRFLTRPSTSPTLAAQFDEILKAFPEAKRVVWDPIVRDSVYEGTKIAFGEALEPRQDFAAADVILSLDSDFLFWHPAQPRAARDFASRRRDPAKMNRLYVVESTPSVTGAKADHRRPMTPRQIEAFAHAVAAAAGGGSTSSQDPFAAAVAADLAAHRGRSLVVAGDAQPASVHALAALMNEALGNVGRTVTYSEPPAPGAEGQAAALKQLVTEMSDGKVQTLVIVGGNPVYDAPANLSFGGFMEKVPLRIHLGYWNDETSRLCHWHVAETHSLEAWSDARALDGTTTILQPLIAPLYDGKSAHELLAAFSERPDRNGHDIVKDYWRTRLPGGDAFEPAWRKAVHDGVVENSAAPAKQVAAKTSLASLAASPQPETRDQKPETGSLTVLFRPDDTVWDGMYANNAWLQELPKPLTKLTWDNAALISPRTAERLKVGEGDVLALEWQGRRLQAPVWVQPGHADDCVTLPLGYGRTRGGRVADGKGFDAYSIRRSETPWSGDGLNAAKTTDSYSLATTQHHHSMEGRDIVRAVAASALAADPEAVRKMGEKPPGPDQTMYPKMPSGTYHWAMSIDIGACVGCNACVIACQSENNIPVVGKDQVSRGRAMQWIRIDRYYAGGLDDPQTYVQPVTCMHCENAPCEPVCPVAATTHSAEGLNEQTYNRCIGTRYCSNNCPYKVRRFNFYLYSDYTTEILKLSRNPEVTVRSRGVMEKCTYCVQRINRARYAAEREERPIRDGEIVPACAQACPARAITFGNIGDEKSEVLKWRTDKRAYGLLTELGTRPRTTYLAEMTNPNAAAEPDSKARSAGEHHA
jgi:molybdopterin-containing oxidoreductase family iron-sulfur binding subunit